MHDNLKAIQEQLDHYESELKKYVTEYHDEQTMSHFSDRFGPDHPMSARADEGVMIQQSLHRIRARIDKFASQLFRDFPT